jgi:hypothetical protein
MLVNRSSFYVAPRVRRACADSCVAIDQRARVTSSCALFTQFRNNGHGRVPRHVPTILPQATFAVKKPFNLVRHSHGHLPLCDDHPRRGVRPLPNGYCAEFFIHRQVLGPVVGRAMCAQSVVLVVEAKLRRAGSVEARMCSSIGDTLTPAQLYGAAFDIESGLGAPICRKHPVPANHHELFLKPVVVLLRYVRRERKSTSERGCAYGAVGYGGWRSGACAYTV